MSRCPGLDCGHAEDQGARAVRTPTCPPDSEQEWPGYDESPCREGIEVNTSGGSASSLALSHLRLEV